MFNLKVEFNYTKNSQVAFTFTKIPYNEVTPVIKKRIVDYILNIKSYIGEPLSSNISTSLQIANSDGCLQVIIPMTIDRIDDYYFDIDDRGHLEEYTEAIEDIFYNYNILKEYYSVKDNFIELQETVDKLKKDFEEFKGGLICI